ncbi:zf-HC2 domain-containing protein [bacterium]|nr:zf-HC2 domain-containing protein [bacterium]
MNKHDPITDDERRLVRRLHQAASRGKPASCPNGRSLSAYLDGRLSEAEAAFFEEHLVACVDCRRALVDARRLLSEPAAPAPRGLTARAKALVAAPSAPARAWGWRSVASWAAAAVAAIALGAAGLNAGSQVGRPRPSATADLVSAFPITLASATVPSTDELFLRLAANGEEASHE